MAEPRAGERLWRAGVATALLAGAIWLTLLPRTTGDYALQAKPFLDAIADGNLSEFLSGPVSMGPLALIARVPSVLAASAFDAGDLARYRAGVLPCALAAAALGYAIAVGARRRGASRLMAFLFAGLVVINPFSVDAVRQGHPEELLTGALLVGAMVSTARGKWWLTGILLGLAISSKQWALVGVFFVVLAAPRYRGRVLAVAVAIAAVAVTPFLVAHPDRFATTQRAAASSGGSASFASVWWPFLPEGTRTVIRDGRTARLSRTRKVPELIAKTTHPGIVILASLLALVAYLRKSLDPVRLTALLTAALLLRAVLDPIDASYYALPALMALLAWEASRAALPGRSPPVPVLSASMVVAGWLTFHLLVGRLPLGGLNVLFLGWTLPLIATTIAAGLLGGRQPGREGWVGNSGA